MRLLIAAVLLISCVGPDGPPATDGEASDFDPVDWNAPDGKADISGISPTFNRNDVMEDSVFTATSAVDGNAVQAFLEATPYGVPSWLANTNLDGVRFADDVVAIAQGEGVDPVVLLARMQVESSLISATATPSTSKLDIALGCGCPDEATCSSAYSGLSRQLHCAAKVLAGKLDESENATGLWRKGHARNTADPITITPASNATAALYAYTPWVLQGSGGNWLVWNVTRKFLKAFDGAGTLHLP